VTIKRVEDVGRHKMMRADFQGSKSTSLPRVKIFHRYVNVVFDTADVASIPRQLARRAQGSLI
jgi:hypothetical protein